MSPSGYNRLTVKQLRELATDRGLDYRGMKKAELVTAIERHDEYDEAAREARKSIVNALTLGADLPTALKYAGATPEQHEDWLEMTDGYAAEVDKAEAQFEVNQLTQLNNAAVEGQWRASDRLLRAQRPGKYGQIPLGGDPDPQERRMNCDNCGAILSADTRGDLCRLCSAGKLKAVEGGA